MFTASRMAALLILLSWSTSALADNWPGWRGDGNGVSAESPLPLEWSGEENIRWKTKVEGEGVSQPIVWNDRVFLSTAAEGAEVAVAYWVVVAVQLGLLGLVALSMLRRSSTVDPAASKPSIPLRLLRWLDWLATGLATLLFFAAVIAVVFAQDRIVEPGYVAMQWGVYGGIAMLGLVAAAGRHWPGSVWRVVLALALVAAVLYFHWKAPLNMSTERMRLQRLVMISGPISLAAAWFFLMFFLFRRADATRPTGGGVWRLGQSLLLALCAVSFFAYFIHMQPRTGLGRWVVCLDRDSGEVLWKTMGFLAPRHRKSDINSYATPTPITDGEYVVAHFGPGMMCVDMDGQLKWTYLEPKFEQFLRYGASSSPTIYGDHAIFPFLAEKEKPFEDGWEEVYRNSYLAGLDLETGEVDWKVCPPGGHDSYNSLVIAQSGSRPAVLLSTYQHVLAYDPATGEEIWVCKLGLNQPVSSIVSDQEHAYVIGGAYSPKAATAIRLGGEGDITDTHVSWEVTRGIPSCSSPIVYEGLMYMIHDNGVATCIDKETGKIVWRKRLKGQYLSSPLAGDGKIYFPATNGDYTVVEAGDKYKELARNSIGEECYAPAAISNGCIFLRSKEHLYCIVADDAA